MEIPNYTTILLKFKKKILLFVGHCLKMYDEGWKGEIKLTTLSLTSNVEY